MSDRILGEHAILREGREVTERAEGQDAKRALRERARLLRASLCPEEVEASSQAIWRLLRELPLWQEARTVHTFVGALPGEVRTDALIAWCFAHGRTVIVPVVDRAAHALRHVRLERLDDLQRTSWGGLEPARGSPADPSDADLIIVPGLAFDRQGHRLGMGGGFYDRFLAGANAPTIAVAHSCQIVDFVPTDEGDVSVSLIVTPEEVIRPSA